MAAARRHQRVQRPRKKHEYELRFASVNAEKGWNDLVATIRNPVAEAWDFLTQSPQEVTPRNYPLKGSLATIQRNGRDHERWQYKPTIKGTSRIWFYVEERTVYIIEVHTSHPNETK